VTDARILTICLKSLNKSLSPSSELIQSGSASFTENLRDIAFHSVLLQPRVEIQYLVSFYFIGRTFHYALYTPRPDQRWAPERYDPTPADFDFAPQFIDWSTMEHGIQRVDACRTRDGNLLLIELI
jgi:hypothetical protein